ncbi:class I SAM-dependent methyltransferase [Cylindrospermopsis curvispora]|uniref:FkbM family methyltransferase n=1 Tax=Cylindrospermopsis curvispora GIHE-G1 TaxID=2666332 RepID=A0A7H0F1N5_9CYAN|nr:hypothetical protein [Cylindrospermopsis curvispora]QNP29951.1 hypothetical protein IAR63_02330 [Cylindrospermopsis curvispora GIHE-G1]
MQRPELIVIIVKLILKRLGLQKIPKTSLTKDLSLQSALSRITTKDIKIKTVIDIGASDGQWTKVVKAYFPWAFYYLIEANPIHLSALQEFKSSQKKVDFILAAA